MKSFSMCFFVTLISIILFLAGCQAKKTVSTVDTPEGNLVGKLCNAAGDPVKGATVLLVPKDYASNASGNDTLKIDSTTSNASGLFGFNVDRSGKYNLLACVNGLYALEPSIAIKASSRLQLPEARLLAPGSLKGSIRLSPGNGMDSVVILLLGTNMYTTPVDTSGKFIFPNLAQGTYTLRILSMNANYAAVDTTVTVVSGGETILAPVTLRLNRVPRIDSFSVQYNPLMMQATLSWMCPDTDIVKVFNIYCNRGKRPAPVLTVAAGRSAAVIDLVLTPEDTCAYQIAAVSKDGWEGPAFAAKPFVNKSAITVSQFGTLPGADRGDIAGTQYCFNAFGTYIFSDSSRAYCRLTKCNSDLSIVKKSSYPGQLDIGLTYLASDKSGNLYALFQPGDTSMDGEIVIFNKDLEPMAKHPYTYTYGPQEFSINPAADGKILVYSAQGAYFWDRKATDTTWVKIFDKDFNLLSQTSYPDSRVILQSVYRGDTMVATIASNAWTGDRIYYFDALFNAMRIDSACTALSAPVPDSFTKVNTTIIAAPDLFFTACNLYDKAISVILFFNNRDSIVARCPHPEPVVWGNIPTDGVNTDGNGHVYSRLSNGKNLNYSIDAVLRAVRR